METSLTVRQPIEITSQSAAPFVIRHIHNTYFSETYRNFLRERKITETEPSILRIARLYELPEVVDIFQKQWEMETDQKKWPNRSIQESMYEAFMHTAQKILSRLKSDRHGNTFSHYSQEDIQVFLQAINDIRDYNSCRRFAEEMGIM